MSLFQIANPALANIGQPCRYCGTLMWLASITPAKPPYEKRTFECPACDYAKEIVVQQQRDNRWQPANALR